MPVAANRASHSRSDSDSGSCSEYRRSCLLKRENRSERRKGSGSRRGAGRLGPGLGFMRCLVPPQLQLRKVTAAARVLGAYPRLCFAIIRGDILLFDHINYSKERLAFTI